jgi:hypothetical protein
VFLVFQEEEVGGFEMCDCACLTFPGEICRHFGIESLMRALYLCGMRIKNGACHWFMLIILASIDDTFLCSN